MLAQVFFFSVCAVPRQKEGTEREREREREREEEEEQSERERRIQKEERKRERDEGKDVVPQPPNPVANPDGFALAAPPALGEEMERSGRLVPPVFDCDPDIVSAVSFAR